MNATVAEAVVKISALMALAALTTGLMGRRASAASRHLVWILAVVAALALPVASAIVPAWRIPVRRAVATTPAVVPSTHEAAFASAGSVSLAVEPLTANEEAPATTMSWFNLLPGAYAAAVVLLLMRLGLEHRKTRQLIARATDVTDPAWLALLHECAADMSVRRKVRLVWTREHTMPMAAGLKRSVIVIPSIAETWETSRRRAVLLHELAHVGRFDCLTQMLAETAVALYWAHPAAWWMARRLRIERELACDDRVLASGTEPAEYATHLLELAYSLSGSRRHVLVVAMAQPRQLEGRLAAVLDRARNRATPGAIGRLVAIAAALAVSVGLAAATPVEVLVASAEQAAPAASSPPAKAAPEVAAEPAGTAAPGTGTWEIRPADMPGRLDVTLRAGRWSMHREMGSDAFVGLVGASTSGANGVRTFTLTREAGTFTFEGVLRGNVGGGTVTFAASPTLAQALARHGLARPTPAEQYSLALADIGSAFLDELNAQGYTSIALPQLVNAAQHGVTMDYVRQMAELGYRLGTVDALIRQREHGISPAYIRELRTQGLAGLTAEDLVVARDHGISAEYVHGLRELGYRPLTLTQLVGARDHGISPEYVRDLRQLGYGFLTLEQLVSARDHGISAEYSRELAQLGYQLPLADLTRARDHGVSPEYVQEIAALGYARLPFDDLLRMRDHGISPEWLRTVKAKNTAALTIDELIRLRAHGVDTPAALLGPQLKSWNMKAAFKAWLDRWLS